MKTVKNSVNRRSFIKVSALTGGGMMLSFSWLAACKSETQLGDISSLPDEGFEINAIKIDFRL